MSDDPRRLLDHGPGDGDATFDALRAALEAGREERPSEAQLASLAAALGPLLLPPGGGGGGGGGSPPVDPSAAVTATTTSLAAKSIAALAVAATVALGAAIGGALLWGRPDGAPVDDASTPGAIETPSPAPPPSLEALVPGGVDVPDDLEPPLAPAVRPRPRADPGPSPPPLEVDPTAELALVRSAQDALRNSPARAIEFGQEHARRFGDGALVQEREVVVIDALHRLGRDEEARARAARFHERWPRSAHGRRVDVIVGGDPRPQGGGPTR